MAFFTGAGLAQTAPPLSVGADVQPGGSARAFYYGFDENGDGEIRLDEFKTAHQDGFRAADVDGDDALTPAEWLASNLAATLPGERPDVLFERLDADGNRLLTQSEFENAADWWFEQLDADGNGALDLDELGP